VMCDHFVRLKRDNARAMHQLLEAVIRKLLKKADFKFEEITSVHKNRD
jgi:hypothetical protein